MAKIGVAWVQAYNGYLPNLSSCRAEAEGFARTLGIAPTFSRGNSTALDLDFEEAGRGWPLAGGDLSAVETVDLVYFAGHGGPDGPRFGGRTADDGTAKSTEVRWGNGNTLKWVVLDCCWTLHTRSTASPVGSDTVSRWGGAFDGLHHILGFRTVCTDERTRGSAFAEYLNEGESVRRAWIKACEETEPGTTKWALLRAGDSFDDHLPGKGTVGAGGARIAYESANC